MKQKIIILFLVLAIVFGNVTVCKASPVIFTDLNKPCNVYSLRIPTTVSMFAKSKFQTVFEAVRREPEMYGISKSHLENMYLGNGFNIFELNNDIPKDQKIYYYPVMYNNKVEAIFAVTPNFDGSCNATIGVQFAKQLQNVFDKYNDGSSFILISLDGNIYAQNKKGFYPIFIYKKNKIDKLNKISYDKELANVKSTFNNSIIINTNKKFDTMPRDYKMAYRSNTIHNNSLSASPLSLTSTWLQVPITSQFGYGCCWAACVASIVNYKRGTNIDALEICDHFGINYNSGAWEDTVVNALKYYGMNYATHYGRPLTDSAVEAWINDNDPIYMDSQTWNNSAHSTVIRGYMVGNGYIQLSMMNSATGKYEAAYCNGGVYSYTMGNETYYWYDTVMSY